MTSPCPRCRRPNASHRETCLYCGERMPNPTAPPPPAARELPANLDELVRRAMAGGGVGALRKALSAAPAPAPEAPAGAEAPVAVSELPAAAVEPVVDLPETGPADPWDTFAQDAETALLLRGDPEALRAALTTLSASIERLAAALPAESPLSPPPPEPVPEVRLPPIRHPFALAMGAVPAGLEVGRLAAALEVDLATARAAVLAGGARIVLRGPDQALLAGRAAALAELGVRARVVDRELLLRAPPAVGLVGIDAVDRWRVVAAAAWGDVRPDPSQLPRGEAHEPDAVRLLVVGEVEEKRLRPPVAESRWQRAHFAAANGAGGEARIAVIDVHTDTMMYRLVEGAVDAKSAPESGSQRHLLRQFTELATSRWPAAHLEPRRVCVAAPRSADRADGWAAFEEHSRMCRSLYLSAPEP